MYTLKSIARRGTLLGAAFALLASSLFPALPVYADALNPLTDRSLTLSSSAPGWDYLDGSGNTTYAPPNSGANGRQVANYYDFRVSTDTAAGDTLKAMSFTYCISPAGDCLAPGDNGWTGAARNADSTATSDLNVVTTTPSQATIADDDPTDYVTMTDTSSATNPNGSFTSVPCSNDEDTGTTGFEPTDCDDIAGRNFAVYYDNGGTWTESPDWTMTATNFEITGGAKAPGSVNGTSTGKNNEIQLEYDAEEDGDGTTGFASGTRIRVVFFATETNYITNPGSGAFFVRINTYNTDGNDDINTMARFAEDHAIDGGVTVANVMNLGIQIVTKVLETMTFSVGVVDPYTLEAAADDNGGSPGGADETSQLAVSTGGTEVHGVCEPILTRMNPSDTFENRLLLGAPNMEYSLAVDTTYSTHSYFRLSSNSSAGATIYYSGNTLTNTVADSIDAIGTTAEDPAPGNEQFGLALAHTNSLPYAVDYRTETAPGYIYETGVDLTQGNVAAGLDDIDDQGVHDSVIDDAISDLDEVGSSWHSPQLTSLVPAAAYANGSGFVNDIYEDNALTSNHYAAADDTEFAFDANSTLIPVPLASNYDQVVDCVTGKVRYIANIAATTPAGIYTTKINYIASPQY